MVPQSGDFARTAMSKELQEEFLDIHNQYRGEVSPEAANMNYLVSWNATGYIRGI